MLKFKNVDELAAHLDNQEKRIASLQASEWRSRTSAKEDVDYSGLGKFLKAVKYNSRQGIEEMGGKPSTWDSEEKADLGSPLWSDATTGSYVVPNQYYQSIAKVAEENSVFLPLVTKIEMTTRVLYIPTETTGPSFSWQGSQSSSLSETNPAFGQTSCTAYGCMAWLGFSASLAEDNNVAMGAWFSQRFGEQWALEMDDKILNGTGTPCYGLLNSSGTATDYVLGAGKTSQDDIQADDFIEAVGTMPYAKHRRGAQWFMSPSCFDAVRRLKNANGDYLVNWQNGNPVSILGYRVNLTDSIATPSTSESFIVFGNPKHVWMGNRVGLEVKLFPDTQYAVTDDEILMRARSRVGFCFPMGASAFVRVKTAAS